MPFLVLRQEKQQCLKNSSSAVGIRHLQVEQPVIVVECSPKMTKLMEIVESQHAHLVEPVQFVEVGQAEQLVLLPFVDCRNEHSVQLLLLAVVLKAQVAEVLQLIACLHQIPAFVEVHLAS